MRRARRSRSAPAGWRPRAPRSGAGAPAPHHIIDPRDRAAGRRAVAHGQRRRRDLRRRQHRQHRRDRLGARSAGLARGAQASRAAGRPRRHGAHASPAGLQEAAARVIAVPPTARRPGGTPRAAPARSTLVLLTASVVLGHRRGACAGSRCGAPRFGVAALHRTVSLLAVALLVVHIATALARPVPADRPAQRRRAVPDLLPPAVARPGHRRLGPADRARADEPDPAAPRLPRLARGALAGLRLLAGRADARPRRRLRRQGHVDARAHGRLRPGRAGRAVAARLARRGPRRAAARAGSLAALGLAAVAVAASGTAPGSAGARAGPAAPGRRRACWPPSARRPPRRRRRRPATALRRSPAAGPSPPRSPAGCTAAPAGDGTAVVDLRCGSHGGAARRAADPPRRAARCRTAGSRWAAARSRSARARDPARYQRPRRRRSTRPALEALVGNADGRALRLRIDLALAGRHGARPRPRHPGQEHADERCRDCCAGAHADRPLSLAEHWRSTARCRPRRRAS